MIRAEQFIFGEAPEASNTGFRLLGHSNGLQSSELEDLERRSNVGPSLASDKRSFRHLAHDVLGSGRHAFSLRVRSATREGGQKLIGQWLVMDPASAAGISNVADLFAPRRRAELPPSLKLSRTSQPGDQRSRADLQEFRETERYRGSSTIVRLPAIDLIPQPDDARGPRLAAAWQDLLTRLRAESAAAIVAEVLRGLFTTRVVLAFDAAETREAVIHLVVTLLPKIDRLAKTWSTLASPRQWSHYDLCAISPREQGFVEEGAIIPDGWTASGGSRSRVIEWLVAAQFDRLDRYVSMLDENGGSLAEGVPAVDLWHNYDDACTVRPDHPEALATYLAPLTRPLRREPNWLVPQPLAERVAESIHHAASQETREIWVDAVARALVQMRHAQAGAFLAALVGALRSFGDGGMFAGLARRLLLSGPALATACTRCIDADADSAWLKQHPEQWTQVARTIADQACRQGTDEATRDLWTQLLVYSANTPRQIAWLFGSLPPGDAFRSARIDYFKLAPDLTAEMVSAVVRKGMWASEVDADDLLDWAAKRNPSAARIALLEEIVRHGVTSDVPSRFVDRITDVVDDQSVGQVRELWARLVHVWLAVAEEQIARIVRDAPDDVWTAWWEMPLRDVAPQHSSTFVEVFARQPAKRPLMCHALLSLLAADPDEWKVTAAVVDCARLDSALVQHALDRVSPEARMRTHLAVLGEGVLAPAKARLWQKRVLADPLVHELGKVGRWVEWGKLQRHYPVFVEQLARAIARTLDWPEVGGLVRRAPIEVVRGVRRALLYRDVPSHVADPLRWSLRVDTPTGFDARVARSVDHLLAWRAEMRR